MQIAVGVNGRRRFLPQFKSRLGCLARMEITDVPALLRFHIEPLDMVDIHHRVLHRTHRNREGAAGAFGHWQMLFAAGFYGVGD